MMSVNIRLGKTLRNHVFKILWQFTKTPHLRARLENGARRYRLWNPNETDFFCPLLDCAPSDVLMTACFSLGSQGSPAARKKLISSCRAIRSTLRDATGKSLSVKFRIEEVPAP
jgi:hypothetical protein